MGSEVLFMAAKMHQLASISEDRKIHNFLKDPSRLCACFLQDITDPEALSFPLNGAELEAHFWSIPATKGKADMVTEASKEKEEGNGKAMTPRVPPYSYFSSLGYLLPSSMPSFHHGDHC